MSFDWRLKLRGHQWDDNPAIQAWLREVELIIKEEMSRDFCVVHIGDDMTEERDNDLEKWEAAIDERFHARGLPELLFPGVLGHVMDGKPTGDFLFAILSNNLYQAALLADPENHKRLSTWAGFCLHDLPQACCGSSEAVMAWRVLGGLAGKR